MSFRVARPLPLRFPVLTRPYPAWVVWVVAAFAAYIVGKAITSKTDAVLVFGGGTVLALVAAIIRRPIVGFYMALAYYPFYSLSRGLVQYLGAPVPLALVGLWSDALLAIMGFGILIGCLRDGYRPRLTANDLPVLFLVLSGVYALFISLAQGAILAGLYGFHSTVTPLLFYTIARWLRFTDRDLKRLIGFWLVPYLIIMALSLADYVIRPQITIEIAKIIRQGFWGTWDPDVFFRWYPRMQSLLFAEQIWGTICAMVLVYCLSILSVRPKVGWAGAMAFLSFFCLVLSMSRGAIIDAVVAVACLFCFRGRHRAAVAGGLVVLLLAGAVAYTVLSDNDRVVTLTKRVGSLAEKLDLNTESGGGEMASEDWRKERVTQWELAVRLFPLFPYGRGLGRAGAQALFHDTGDDENAIADGGIFKILSEAGLPGVLFFLIGGGSAVLVFLRLTAVFRQEPYSHDYALGRFLVCMLCGLLVHNIGGNIFDAYYIQPLYWLLAGMFVTRAEAKAAEIGQARSDLVPVAGERRP